MNKRLFLASTLFLVVATVVFGQDQAMPSVNVANSLDRERVEIIPLDVPHQASIPSTFNVDLKSVPPGSFILKNQRDKPMTVVDVVWTYSDRSGHSYKRR